MGTQTHKEKITWMNVELKCVIWSSEKNSIDFSGK